jgi:hypothetical protein
MHHHYPFNHHDYERVRAGSRAKSLMDRILFSGQPQGLQKFSDSLSHRIFRHMHEALNIDKKIKLITQFRRNGRDESFKPN